MEGAVAAAAAEGADVTESVVSEAAASAGTRAAAQAEAAAGNGRPAEPDAQEQIGALQGELEAERARYAELYERFQRSAADFQNSRRRAEKQAQESIERASEHVIRRLLPVLDDFDRAFQNVPGSLAEDQAAWVSGFSQIQKKLQDLLKDEGVTLMPLDGPFDPSRHEAVTSEPSDDVESGHIIGTLRPGYEARGRVLRPALVRVAA